jgi:outer membrane murein-binding lipoprotein Lpp
MGELSSEVKVLSLAVHKLETKIDAVEARLEAKIDDVDAKTNKIMNTLNRIDERATANAKITWVFFTALLVAIVATKLL